MLYLYGYVSCYNIGLSLRNATCVTTANVSQQLVILSLRTSVCVYVVWTRTTRTPAFWDNPAAPWLPILVIHIRSQVQTRLSQSYNFWNNAKISKFESLNNTSHSKYLLKLLDKMYKYEMDSTRTVGAAEWTTDAGRTEGQTDRRADGRSETIIAPTSSLCGGIITLNV